MAATTEAAAMTEAPLPARIFVAGHRGMVGSAVVRRLAAEPVETITAPRAALDLRDGAAVRAFLDRARPDAIVLAAAKVGGILANATQPVAFLRDNLAIEQAVIGAAADVGVPRLMFLGSSCIYPRLAPQPIPEDALLTGPLEPTNQWYAVAKIAGLFLARAFREERGLAYHSVMPTNLYGPHDNFDPATSHVLPALIRRFAEAAETGAAAVTLWGTGAPLREFMHVDDLADAIVFLLRRPVAHDLINIGSGQEVSIRDLAGLVAAATGFDGAIRLDPSKPDGTPRKLMDSSRLAAMGWHPRIPLDAGIAATVAWWRENRRG
jgi:GDP-L-fucose synthase